LYALGKRGLEMSSLAFYISARHGAFLKGKNAKLLDCKAFTEFPVVGL